MSNDHSIRSFDDSPSVTELFHRINRVIPDEQKIVSVPPEMPVTDALELMDEHGFSQVPVVVGREVLGLFSYRSFARAVIIHSRAATKNKKFEPLELVVDECLNPKPHFARVTDEFVEWFDVIDRNDSVLVGEPNRLQAIVTAMDILRYLYRVASPFVLISEVERALRALMHMAVDGETLTACARECLKDKYDQEKSIHTGGEECAMPAWLHSEWRLLHAYVPACSGPARASLSGKRDFKTRDKGTETASLIQFLLCRDRALARDPRQLGAN